MSKENGWQSGLGQEYDQLTSGLRKQFGVFYELATIPVSDFRLYPDKDIPMVTAHILKGVVYLKKYGKDRPLRNLGRAAALITQDRVRIIPARDMDWELCEAGFSKKEREERLPDLPQYQVVWRPADEPNMSTALEIYVPIPQFVLKVGEPAIFMADIISMAVMMRDVLHHRECIDRKTTIYKRARAYTAHFFCEHLTPIGRHRLTGVYQRVLQEFPYGLRMGCDNILYGEDRRGLSDPLDDLGDLYYG
jgi:hypothetical protein